MTKLYAVAVDRYTSNQTNEGVIYNIVDQDKNIVIQCQVSHKKYTLHDLLIDNISSAPSNIRNAIQRILNKKYNSSFEIVTVLTDHMMSGIDKINHNITDDSVKLSYDINQDKVLASKIRE